MSFNLEQMLREKRALRDRLAARPIAEKLRMLDALRERTLTIHIARSPKTNAIRDEPPDLGKHHPTS